MRYSVTIGEHTLELDVEPRSGGGYLVRGGDERELSVDSLGGGPELQSLLVDGRVLTVQPAEGEVRLHGERYRVHAESFQARSTAGRQSEATLSRAIVAAMPGRIVRVACEVGARVSANAPLIVIEAMKMQNELCAKSDATVRALHVSVGQTVERGTVLVEFE